jgi:hypothetical protein
MTGDESHPYSNDKATDAHQDGNVNQVVIAFSRNTARQKLIPTILFQNYNNQSQLEISIMTSSALTLQLLLLPGTSTVKRNDYQAEILLQVDPVVALERIVGNLEVAFQL